METGECDIELLGPIIDDAITETFTPGQGQQEENGGFGDNIFIGFDPE